MLSPRRAPQNVNEEEGNKRNTCNDCGVNGAGRHSRPNCGADQAAVDDGAGDLEPSHDSDEEEDRKKDDRDGGQKLRLSGLSRVANATPWGGISLEEVRTLGDVGPNVIKGTDCRRDGAGSVTFRVTDGSLSLSRVHPGLVNRDMTSQWQAKAHDLESY